MVADGRDRARRATPRPPTSACDLENRVWFPFPASTLHVQGEGFIVGHESCPEHTVYRTAAVNAEVRAPTWVSPAWEKRVTLLP